MYWFLDYMAAGPITLCWLWLASICERVAPQEHEKFRVLLEVWKLEQTRGFQEQKGE